MGGVRVCHPYKSQDKAKDQGESGKHLKEVAMPVINMVKGVFGKEL